MNFMTISHEILRIPFQIATIIALIYFMSRIFDSPIDYKNKVTIGKILIVTLVYKVIPLFLCGLEGTLFFEKIFSWFETIPEVKMFLDDYLKIPELFCYLLLLLFLVQLFFKNISKREKLNGSMLSLAILYGSLLLWNIIQNTIDKLNGVSSDRIIDTVVGLGNFFSLYQPITIAEKLNIFSNIQGTLLRQYDLIPLVFLLIFIIILSRFKVFFSSLIKSNKYYKFNLLMLSIVAVWLVISIEPIKRYILYRINRLLH